MMPHLRIPFLENNQTGSYIRTRTIESVPFWIGAAVSSALAVAYASIFELIEHFCLGIVHTHPYWLFGLTPICFLISWYSVMNWSPEATGSGIPQLMAAIEMDPKKDDSFLERLLGWKMALIKSVSSYIAVVGGAIVGPEGPTLHFSGFVFYYLRKWLPAEIGELSFPSMMLAGAAAGLAAAFNTPLGGIVYVVEELAKTHLNIFRTTVLQAVLISGLIAQFLAGPYLYLGFPTLAAAPASFLGVCVLIGAFTGAAGAFYGILIIKTGAWIRSLKPMHSALVVFGFGLTFALIVNVVGDFATGCGKHVLLDLLFRDKHSATALESVARYVGGVLSYSIGGAGGVFAPSLAAGATIGSWFQSIVPYPAPHLLVLVGMVGFLTGMTQTPFTAFVLVLEMTDRHSCIFYLMIAAVISHAVSRLVSHESFYEVARRRFQLPKEVKAS